MSANMPTEEESEDQQMKQTSSDPEKLLGLSLKSLDLVDYQEGGVVSRTILKGPGGTITAFAFAQGEALSEHSAPFDALVQVMEGEVEVRIAGKANQLGPGEMIIMPANVPHALSALTRFKMLLIMVK